MSTRICAYYCFKIGDKSTSLIIARGWNKFDKLTELVNSNHTIGMAGPGSKFANLSKMSVNTCFTFGF